ncbi:MAG: transposase [Solirubrobacteraceae bacterium]|nr:transposase [Solirubrobacteraceae bacterium]
MHGDWLRDAVALIARQLMEAGVEQKAGAARGERSAGRVTNLNG